MSTVKMNQILEQIRGEMNGQRQHDRAVLLEWADRYKGNIEAGPLLREIGLMLFKLDEEIAAPVTQGFLDEAAERMERTLAEAEALMSAGRYEEAIEMFAPAVEELDGFSLPETSVWTDFHSFLDGLLFEDYFSEEIDGREVRRHPLRPARLLRSCGEALVFLERYDEAVPVLERLTGLDPVCAEDLCTLADAYLCADRAEDAWDTAGWALFCASTNEEAAQCYLLLALCRSETEDWENAAVLLRKSLLVSPSEEAEAVLAEMEAQTGIRADFTKEEINRRCEAMEVPTGRSEAVELNLAFLEQFNP